MGGAGCSAPAALYVNCCMWLRKVACMRTPISCSSEAMLLPSSDSRTACGSRWVERPAAVGWAARLGSPSPAPQTRLTKPSCEAFWSEHMMHAAEGAPPKHLCLAWCHAAFQERGNQWGKNSQILQTILGMSSSPSYYYGTAFPPKPCCLGIWRKACQVVHCPHGCCMQPPACSSMKQARRRT